MMMRMALCLCAVMSVWADTSGAAIYYVTKAGSDANGCVAAENPATPKLTLISVLGCESAGDTILIGDGTYTDTSIGSRIASGASVAARTTLQAMNSRMVIYQPAASSTGGHVLLLSGQSNIAFIGIVFDGTNVTQDAMKVQSLSNGNLWEDVELRNSKNQGLLCVSGSTTGTIRKSHIHHNGDSVTGKEHGLYISDGCNNWVIENNEINHNSSMGAQLYSTPQNTIFQFNYIHDNCTLSPNLQEFHVSHSNNTVRNNVLILSTCVEGMRINYNSPLNTKIQHNSIYCRSGPCSVGVRVQGGTGARIENNIILGFATPTIDTATGSTFTNNRLTGNPQDIWTTPAGSDLTLKAGSPAIDAGADLGGSKCGTLPDQGAFEVCGFSAASIVGHTLDVTMDNIYPPVQVFGATGWSVTCTPNPDACGSPTVDSATLLSGSGSVVRLSITGLANIDCTSNQIWTVSFNASTVSLSDYVIMGGQLNQFAHSFTGRAVTNNCTGSGGTGPPLGAYIYYPMDGNANDSSGGNRHATVSGVSFTPAKYSQGMQTTASLNAYAELPYLSGVDPTTQSLTIAYGVYIPANDMGISRNLGGVPLGTNQRLYVSRTASNNWRLATQSNAAASATEFSVQAGWSFVCVTMDAATDTATLSINGAIGASAGASVQPYTSYTFAGNYRIGLPSGVSASFGGTHLYDEFRLYQSVANCADLYAAWEPPTSIWTGTLSLAAARLYGAKTNWVGGDFPLAPLNTNTSVSPGGVFTYAGQIDCTAADCSAVSYVLYYSCAACPSAGVALLVPSTASADQLEMFGPSAESGLLAGAYGSNLSGALAHILGGTLLTAAPTSGPDLAQNNSTVHRGTVRFTDAATIGRQYCFKWREQSGLPLNSYTPSGGVCVTVGAPAAAAGF